MTKHPERKHDRIAWPFPLVPYTGARQTFAGITGVMPMAVSSTAPYCLIAEQMGKEGELHLAQETPHLPETSV